MLNNITILYVDDEPINITLFKVSLRNKFNIISALSGNEALDLLDTNKEISIVISDNRMPSMSGVEFVNHAYEKYPHIHYYIFSGVDITDDIQLLLDNKILTNFFSKPINFEHIVEEINCLK